ncbi:MAG: GatB/YqeY domain-containing protein [Dehalococcoidales bacterium]
MAEALKEKLADDVKQALRQGDKQKVSCLRLLLAAVKNAEIARQTELSDTDVLGVIVKQAKQCRESIDAFKKGDRPDLVAQEEAELAILEAYLPQQMTPQEISDTVSKVIAEVGAEGPGDMGRVMAKLMPQLKGRADGRQVNAIVSELLKK